MLLPWFSPISAFKTLPNSNFSFGEVEGFDAHCFIIINGVFFFLLHLHRYYYCYHQYTFFRLFIYSFVSIIRIITIATISIHFFSRLFIPLIFSHRVPSNLFQKLILHIFEKRKKVVSEQACLLQAGRWLSLHRNSRRMAVYQSWDSKAWYFEY